MIWAHAYTKEILQKQFGGITRKQCVVSSSTIDVRGVLLWAPPRPGFVKFNVDGIAKGCPRLTRCGGVLQNEMGETSALFSGDVDFVHVQREANGMMYGLAKAALIIYLPIKGAVETEGSQIDLEVEVPRLIGHHLVDKNDINRPSEVHLAKNIDPTSSGKRCD
ncbi:hypothetical protein GOBAR_AA13295 [Gossypium barbadense]|uniref:Uncharacterized protein n=1 Tax=Gossypium barbadense TaxID=3634 RepID=A0A2P5XVF7_GOSBA|nr:hypothetical protein GOBAR_AA13295 [Gossypium barbadense]